MVFRWPQIRVASLLLVVASFRNVIPEPGTIALAVFGLAGVALAIRRRMNAAGAHRS